MRALEVARDVSSQHTADGENQDIEVNGMLSITTKWSNKGLTR